MIGELTVRPVARSDRLINEDLELNQVLLKWELSKEPKIDYLIDLYDLEKPSLGWQTINRFSHQEISGRKFTGLTVKGLDPGHSYRFRVIPYRDDLYGPPLETLTFYDVPILSTSVLGEDPYWNLKNRRFILPPPKGPLKVDIFDDNNIRLKWFEPSSFKCPEELRDQIEYIVEYQIPKRRFWFELGRTRQTNFEVLQSRLDKNDRPIRFQIRSLISSNLIGTLDESLYSLSLDGLKSEWIYFSSDVDNQSKLKSRLDNLVPTKLDTLHVGTKSVLLRWDLPPNVMDLKYSTSLILESRLMDDHLKPSIWEPVVRLSSRDTMYEIQGLKPGTKYDFRIVAKNLDTQLCTSARFVQLERPVQTRGPGLFDDLILAKDSYSLMNPPRKFVSDVISSPDGLDDRIRLSWQAPEVSPTLESKLTYSIEMRIYDSFGKLLTPSWILVKSKLTDLNYYVDHYTLEKLSPQLDDNLLEKHRSRQRLRVASIDSTNLDEKQYEFRICALLDESNRSLPAKLPNFVSLTSSAKRAPLKFINLDANKTMIYSVLNERLELLMEVEGWPKPHVEWFLNHLKLNHRLECRISQLGFNQFELVIDKVQSNHAGLLECRASNNYETLSMTWELVVINQPRFTRLGWSGHPREYQFKHGDCLNLQIPVDNVGSGQEWFTKVWLERLDRQKMTKESDLADRVQLSIAHGWVQIVVDRMGLYDTGLYRLWIENQAGNDCIDLFLKVLDKPHAKLAEPRVRPHGPGTLVIEWDPPEPGDILLESLSKYTGYRIEYCRENYDNQWHLLGTTSADQNQMVVRSQLVKGVDYRFRVRLENWHGLGPASNPSNVAQLPVFGVTEIYYDDYQDNLKSSKSQIHHFTKEGLFSQKYKIVERLHTAKHSSLYQLIDKSTKQKWLATITDLEPGPKRSTSALDEAHKTRSPFTTLNGSRPSSRQTNKWTDMGMEKSIRRQIDLMNRLEQESLTNVHEIYTEPKRTICVLKEMIAGNTLWHELGRRITLTENKAAQILHQLLSATATLHDTGRVHLGLQPENIYFMDDTHKQVSLAGMGSTIPMHEDKHVRLRFRSTVYLPPELSHPIEPNKSYQISPSTDMWSLGLLLYQMTTGDTTNAPEPKKLKKMNYSPKMIDFVENLLHKDPIKRMSASEALIHPWMKETHQNILPSVSMVQNQHQEQQHSQVNGFHTDIESSDDLVSVADRINKRAYSRLLRWLDASYLENIDDSLAKHKIINGLYDHTYNYQNYTSTETSEFIEDEVVIHAKIAISRGQIPQILLPLTSIRCNEGSTVIFSCAIQLSKPLKSNATKLDKMEDLQIQWNFNGCFLNVGRICQSTSSIPSNQHYTCTYDSHTGQIKLHIQQVTVYDAGTYELIVKGLYGDVSDSANLKVYGKFDLFVK